LSLVTTDDWRAKASARVMTATKMCNLLVCLSLRELKLGTNNTPDNASGEEHLRARAAEAILLVNGAHIR
jgi:hypothetical protein